MNLPMIRLSKDGKWAVCADLTCGERFARCREGFLDFPAGWVPSKDGVWHMSRRVRKRVSQGRQPAFRAAPSFPADPSNGRNAPAGRDRAFRPMRQTSGWYPPEGRAVLTVTCPACGRRQVGDADVLRLR